MFRNKYKADNDTINPDKALIKYLSVRMKQAQSASEKPEPIHSVVKIKKRRLAHAAAAIAACLAILLSAGSLYLHFNQDQLHPAVNTDQKKHESTDESTEKKDVNNFATYTELYNLIRSMEQTADFGSDEDFISETAPAAMPGNNINGNPIMKGGGATGAATQATQATNGKANSRETDSHSKTNTQVQGVDEADIVKTDGEYIYTLVDGKLKIVSVNGSKMKMLSSIDVGAGSDVKSEYKPLEFYIKDDRLIVLKNKYKIDSDYSSKPRAEIAYDGCYVYNRNCSVVADVYDLSDRDAPKLIGSSGQSGYYLSSRMVGQTLYLITNHNVYDTAVKDSPETYIPMIYSKNKGRIIPPADIYISKEPQGRQYIVVTSVDIANPDKQISSKTVFGCGSTLYASTENLMIASGSNGRNSGGTPVAGRTVPQVAEKTQVSGAVTPDDSAGGSSYTEKNKTTTTTYTNSTNLLRFSLSDGKIELAAKGSIKGNLLNQFSMDEHNGVFRFVTTVSTHTETTSGSGENALVTYTPGTTTNSLYTLNPKLEVIGKIENLAQNERVYSVRFSGDIGYFVTFRQTDPLFAVDLGNPAKPKVLSALKIPGFSEYLHPWSDNLLFGLGRDADLSGRAGYMKISMFDVSDPTDVSEKNKLILDGYYYSDASYNHKAIVISPERGIVAFPCDNKYLIVSYTQNGFVKKAELSVDNYGVNQRGLYIDDVFYVCTNKSITAYSMDNYKKLATLKF